MATQMIANPRWARHVTYNSRYEIGNLTVSGGLAPNQQEGLTDPWCKETAGQTYVAGDLVYIDANGTVAIAQTSTNKLVAPVLGQALSAATGVTGAQARVAVIRPGDIFRMNLYHTTPASAVGTQAMIGTRRGVWRVSTTNQWTVDLVTTVEGSGDSGAAVRIIGWPDRGFDGAANTITDVYAVVYVQFLAYSRAQTGTASQTEVLQYQD